MTEDKAEDELGGFLAALDGFYTTGGARTVVFRRRARLLAEFLRDNPDVAQALGIFGGADPGTVSCQSCGWPRSAHDYGVFCR